MSRNSEGAASCFGYGSESLFGMELAHDDPYLFSGKVQYFSWKLIGVQEALVPYTLPNPKLFAAQIRAIPWRISKILWPWGGKKKERRGKLGGRPIIV